MSAKKEESNNVNFSEMGEFLNKNLKNLVPLSKDLNKTLNKLGNMKEELMKSQVNVLLKEKTISGSKSLTDKNSVIVEFETKEEAEAFYDSLK